MPRVNRLIQRARADTFDGAQHFIEDALRGRTARAVRLHIRRMEPLAVRTPRWSEPAAFLEDLALDLAVGNPGVGCRTVDLRPLKGRQASESWQFTLHVFAQLGRREWRHQPPAIVADRWGFRFALAGLIEEAHLNAPNHVALLAHGAEHAPPEIVEDLLDVWAEYAERYPADRRATMLLAGTVATDWCLASGPLPVDLLDYGAAEAAAAIVSAAGEVPLSTLQKAAHFSGGIPKLVRAMGERCRKSPFLPDEGDAILSSLGPAADEIRGAVDIVHMDSALADRLYDLASGESLPHAPEVDDALTMAGLIRRVKAHGEVHVRLRAPAIGTLLT